MLLFKGDNLLTHISKRTESISQVFPFFLYFLFRGAGGGYVCVQTILSFQEVKREFTLIEQTL